MPRQPEPSVSEAPASEGARTASDAEYASVWDLPVRVCHWTLVVAVAGAFITNRFGVNYFTYHVFCGYVVLVAAVFRIVWGLAGSHHARFRSFVRSPRETMRYGVSLVSGRRHHYAGHNPLGALMVVALLAALVVQASAGLFGNDDIFNVGPLYGYVSKELSLLLTSLHKRLFYVIALAAGLHVLAVLAHSFVFKEKLIQAMFTGRKPAVGPAEPERAEPSRNWLAAGLCAALSLMLAGVVIFAPAPVTDFARVGGKILLALVGG